MRMRREREGHKYWRTRGKGGLQRRVERESQAGTRDLIPCTLPFPSLIPADRTGYSKGGREQREGEREGEGGGHIPHLPAVRISGLAMDCDMCGVFYLDLLPLILCHFTGLKA